MLTDRDIREQLGHPANTPTEKTPEPSSPKKRRPGIILALAAALLVLWGCGFGLILHLERTSPRTPSPQTGQIFRLHDPRKVIYGTSQQRWIADGAVLALPLLTLGFGLAALRRPAKPASRKPPLW